jgi:hypothetical protein
MRGSPRQLLLHSDRRAVSSSPRSAADTSPVSSYPGGKYQTDSIRGDGSDVVQVANECRGARWARLECGPFGCRGRLRLTAWTGNSWVAQNLPSVRNIVFLDGRLPYLGICRVALQTWETAVGMCGLVVLGKFQEAALRKDGFLAMPA